MREYIKKSTFTAPLLSFVVVILSVFSKWLMTKLSFAQSEELFLSYIIIEIVIFVLPGIFYIKMKPAGYTVDLNLVSFGFSALPLIIIMFFVMAFGGILLSLLFSVLGVQGSGALSETAISMVGGEYFSGTGGVVYVSLALAVVPAFAEEFIFRGILLREYRDYGILPSVLVTSFLFAILHFDLGRFPFYFAAGLALGFTAYTTRSTMSSVLLHALFNLFSLFGLPLIANFISLSAGTVLILYLAVVFFLLFLMLAIGEAERLFMNYSTAGVKSYAPMKRKGIFSPVLELFTPSLFLCLLLYLLGALQIIHFPE